MIKALIENYKELTAVGVAVIMMAWYLWHQTKRQAKREDDQDKERIKREEKRNIDQKEEREYYRNLVKEDLRKNIDLNIQGITLQKEMMNSFKNHNGHAEKFSEKVIESLDAICNKLNGKME